MSPLTSELDRLFREHYYLVYRTAYGVTGSSEDAKDVLQTIFLQLLKREFPPDLSKNPKAYLYRAAVNASLNTVKARKRHIFTEDSERFEAKPEIGQADALEVLHDRLYKAMTQLDNDAAHMLILRYVHHHSDTEIAKFLGKSRGVVAVRLYRARARLKKLITEDEKS
jgi:RNA polymerase sigma-70 factor (ECF subfamily)